MVTGIWSTWVLGSGRSGSTRFRRSMRCRPLSMRAAPARASARRYGLNSGRCTARTRTSLVAVTAVARPQCRKPRRTSRRGLGGSSEEGALEGRALIALESLSGTRPAASATARHSVTSWVDLRACFARQGARREDAIRSLCAAGTRSTPQTQATPVAEPSCRAARTQFLITKNIVLHYLPRAPNERVAIIAGTRKG